MIWSVPPLMLLELVLAAIVAAAVMTLVLFPLALLALAQLSMLEHLTRHINLAVELTLLVLLPPMFVLEVNRRHLMADSLLLAMQFVNDPIHLYDGRPVVVNIVALNRLHRLAVAVTAATKDHLANCCSLADVAAAAATAVYGYAVDVAVSQQSLDRAEYFDSVFVDYDTTSKQNSEIKLIKKEKN